MGFISIFLISLYFQNKIKCDWNLIKFLHQNIIFSPKICEEKNKFTYALSVRGHSHLQGHIKCVPFCYDCLSAVIGG